MDITPLDPKRRGLRSTTFQERDSNEVMLAPWPFDVDRVEFATNYDSEGQVADLLAGRVDFLPYPTLTATDRLYLSVARLARRGEPGGEREPGIG